LLVRSQRPPVLPDAIDQTVLVEPEEEAIPAPAPQGTSEKAVRGSIKPDVSSLM
jgi:hypothetical protein